MYFRCGEIMSFMLTFRHNTLPVLRLRLCVLSRGKYIFFRMLCDNSGSDLFLKYSDGGGGGGGGGGGILQDWYLT